MKGGVVYKQPECCTTECECPICLEPKKLKGLNCGHYICEEDILKIISVNRLSPVCPICKMPITDYGCGDERMRIFNSKVHHDNEDEDTDTERNLLNNDGYDSDDDSGRRTPPIYGGKRKRYTRKISRKKNKRPIKSSKRKTKCKRSRR